MKMSPNVKQEKEIKDSSSKCLTRKHLAERQRRARINKLLENLETLVLPEEPESNPVKLEKAEVLERTVEYVKNLSNKQKDVKTSYTRGYMECMRGICNFLSQSNMPSAQVDRMQSYLLSHVTKEESRGQSPISNGHINSNTPYQQTMPYMDMSPTRVEVANLSHQSNCYAGVSRDFQPAASSSMNVLAYSSSPVLTSPSVDFRQSQCLQDVSSQYGNNESYVTMEIQRAEMYQPRNQDPKMWRPW